MEPPPASEDGAAGRAAPNPWLAFAAFLGIAFLTAGVGVALSGSDVAGTYDRLVLPSWAPPAWLFGPVWSVLYVLIGVAGWRAWLRAGGFGDRPAWQLYGAQLVLNAAWSPVFFGVEAFGLAVLVIVALAAAIAGTIEAFSRIDRLAAGLLVPYALWVLFATGLNLAVWVMNR